MTLGELMKKVQQVSSQISTAWIPIKDKDGNDIDIDFKIVCKDDNSCQLSHIELIEQYNL